MQFFSILFLKNVCIRIWFQVCWSISLDFLFEWNHNTNKKNPPEKLIQIKY